MKIVLVTGCAGFIGSHVAEELLKRGDCVIGIDEVNDYYATKQKEENLKILEKYENFKFFKKNLAEFKDIKQIFEDENISYIAHLAARAGVRPSIENPFIYEESNIKATLNLLELGKIFGIKNFVLTSSSSVYGNQQKVPFSEKDVV
ncbi:MAG: GDP-mannose 4,6-dehydratase, partial [Nanoarchaeota archaeon]|nr:GDP-mannose 4,6-dehydratase [Nanoarchaeota archaeon]